jgi:hypothetical protein
MKINQILLWLVIMFAAINITTSVLAEELPARLQVALMSKIIAMENNLATKVEITIYVLDAPKINDLLKSEVGLKIGRTILKKVDAGKNVPKEKYDVIYIGSLSQQQMAVAYATENSVMSLYPIIDGMDNLGSLGLGIKSGKPTFLLNIGQSKSEGLTWNPAILKVSATK